MTMQLTRSRFLRYGAAGGAALYLPTRFGTGRAHAAGSGESPHLMKFVDRLPVPAVIDAKSGGTYSIAAREFTTYSFHADLGPAKTWGYGGAPYLGPTFEVRKDLPVTIEWANELPGGQFLPVDLTIPGATIGPSPITPHLHGGFTLPQYDGHPMQWFTADGDTGERFFSRSFVYGNQQRATLLWYHDHAHGNTRLNVYAGLAGLYFIRDEHDTGAADNPLGLPAGPYEIPLVLQDKTFDAAGHMIYPDEGVTDAHPLWEPEFFGDVPVVNGKAYPFVDVEPRRYRLRIVNGSQARFYNLKLASERGNAELPFHLIGAEGGFLRAPVQLTKLLIAPGERMDVIVDFAAGGRSTQWLLKNDARAPFPSGEHGDMTQLVQFRVAPAAYANDTTTPGERIDLPALDALPAPTRTRTQHLRELLDAAGEPVMLQVEDLAFLDPVTTMPAAGSTEDWQLVNTTADTHPIHLHLVQFEVIDRRPFNAAAYLAGQGIVYTGPAVPAPPTENGRKDTVKAHPGEVTTIRATFDLPTYGPIELPEGTSHPQYVWHCHILEHEENDMMRPFELV